MKKKILDIMLSNGVFISVCIGVAYLLSFYYQSGKLNYYGIPHIYMEFDIINILEIAILVFSVTIVVMFPIVYLINISINIYDHRIQSIVTLALGVVIAIGVDLFVNKRLTLMTLVYFIIFMLYTGFQLLCPLIFVKSKKTYKEKWIEYTEKSHVEETPPDEVSRFCFSKRIMFIPFYVLLFAILCVAFSIAGSKSVANQEIYYIANDYDNKAVVYYTKDIYVLMPYNGNTLGNSYEFVDAKEIGELSMENIGVLSFDKDN